MSGLMVKSLLMAASVSAVKLYAAHSDGNVTSLALTGSDNNYTLSVTSRTADCKANPAVLTLDQERRVLYCYDRGGSADTIGSFNSFAIADDGSLTRTSRIEAPYGGVWGEILTVDNGNHSYISASYTPGAVSVFSLGEDGTIQGTAPAQVLNLTIEATGPVADRQEASHVHEVIIDPTRKYVLTPDLGGDRIRVFTYDPDTIAPLVELDPLRTEAGTGPRHGVFRVNDAGETFLFFNGELSQNVYSYKVTYGDAGLSWEQVFQAPALGLNSTLAPTTAPTSECRMTPDNKFLIISNREKSFANSTLYQSGPSDTLSTWTISEDGTLSFLQNAPSGGWSPRQFSLNKAGDLIAVGHQNNRTVIIWKRDVETGLIITEENGGKVGEAKLSGAVVTTIWDE